MVNVSYTQHLKQEKSRFLLDWMRGKRDFMAYKYQILKKLMIFKGQHQGLMSHQISQIILACIRAGHIM